MAFIGGYTTLSGDFHRRRPSIPVLWQSDQSFIAYFLVIYLYPSCAGKRRLSTRAQSTTVQFAESNAYELLGVSETSSFAEVKASFRKLAKETHPDLVQSANDSSASQRFVQILAAYEILSDSEKRAHYDQYLLSQRRLVQTHSRQGSAMYTYKTSRATVKQMEVVEWLKWYRYAIKDIVAEKSVAAGSSYFDVLERDFYSAIHAAYYGPEIDSLDLLPDRFEAEERSVYGTTEVLHLVSGRDLFGMVCVTNKIPELSYPYYEKLKPFASENSGLGQYVDNMGSQMSSGAANVGMGQMPASGVNYHISDAYKDLELHVSGRVVAMATRLPPKSNCNGIGEEDSEDHIHIYLSSHEESSPISQGSCRDSSMGFAVGSRIPLGTITGLGTSPEEGSCFVYDNNGMKTHVIMKHRTLLVKHMHWYEVGDKVSICECRCSRARLPPSKFWLFEPRCGMHDIGGWYVETFGGDKKGRTVPAQRYWDGFEANNQFDKRLHPAMYLLALAYRTLDMEDAKRRKKTTRDIVETQLFRILRWCKKLV